MHASSWSLPNGVELVRTTPELDESSVPPDLLQEHRLPVDVWGRLVVRAGALTFSFDGPIARQGIRVVAPGTQVIPPDLPHHLVLDGPVRFVVEIHRAPAADTVSP